MKRKNVDNLYIHYLYKIVNNLNGMYYFGIHSLLKELELDPLEDGYWGSGTKLVEDEEKFGLENFTKSIIDFRKTRKGILKLEGEVVTEDLVKDPMCYNQIIGGLECSTGYNKTLVIDKLIGKRFFIGLEEFYEDKKLPENERRYNNISQNKVSVYRLDENGNLKIPLESLAISTDEYHKWKNVKYKTTLAIFGQNHPEIHSDIVLVKSINDENDIRQISRQDPLYLSGEFVPFWLGRKHKEETKLKISEQARKRIENKTFNNPTLGKMWITNKVETKLINSSEKIPEGWIKGRANTKHKCINIKTGEIKLLENYFKLVEDTLSDSSDWKLLSFLDGNNKVITKDQIIKLYKEMGSLIKVSKFLNKPQSTLGNLCKIYGLSFKTK